MHFYDMKIYIFFHKKLPIRYLFSNREYAMLRLAYENVAKKSRIMMLLISALLIVPVTQENSY